MARSSIAWADVWAYVEDLIGKEGTRPNIDIARTLGNEALYKISEATECVKTYWDNSATGDLTLTDNTCPLPVDCLRVVRVEWDGSATAIDRTTIAELDFDESGWRDRTGDPSKWTIDGKDLILNSAPSNATGKLLVRGIGTLPPFSETDGATNPLTYLPIPQQLCPAYYIVWRYPLRPAEPRTDSEFAFRSADLETQRRMGVRTEHKTLWDEAFTRIVDKLAMRQREQYLFDEEERFYSL